MNNPPCQFVDIVFVKKTILLNYSDGSSKIEETEKLRFTLDLLNSMGVDVSAYSADKQMSVEERIKFKQLLLAYNIQIIDEFDAGMKLYLDKEVVGEWKKSSFKIKKDVSEVDPRKKIYVEMTIENWSVFEDK